MHPNAHLIPHENHPDYISPTATTLQPMFDMDALADTITAKMMLAMTPPTTPQKPARDGTALAAARAPLDEELARSIEAIERVVRDTLASPMRVAKDATDAATVGDDWISRARTQSNVVERVEAAAAALRRIVAEAEEDDAMGDGDDEDEGGGGCDDGAAPAPARRARKKKKKGPPPPPPPERELAIDSRDFGAALVEALGGDDELFQQFRRASRHFRRGTITAAAYVRLFYELLDGSAIEDAAATLGPRLVALVPASHEERREELRAALAASEAAEKVAAECDRYERAEAEASERLKVAAVVAAAAAVKTCLPDKATYKAFKRVSRSFRGGSLTPKDYVAHCFGEECFATPKQRAVALERLPQLIADDALRESVMLAVSELRDEERVAAAGAAAGAVRSKVKALKAQARSSISGLTEKLEQSRQEALEHLTVERDLKARQEELESQLAAMRMAVTVEKMKRAVVNAGVTPAGRARKNSSEKASAMDAASARVDALAEQMEHLEEQHEETLGEQRRAASPSSLTAPLVRKVIFRVPCVRRNGVRRYARELVVWTDCIVTQVPAGEGGGGKTKKKKKKGGRRSSAASGVDVKSRRGSAAVDELEDGEHPVSAPLPQASAAASRKHTTTWHYDRIVSINAGSKRSANRKTSTKFTIVVKKCVVFSLPRSSFGSTLHRASACAHTIPSPSPPLFHVAPLFRSSAPGSR